MGINTAFVLLAGGKSERMGLTKGLLKYRHTYWILEQLNRISKTQISIVYIGLGFNYQHYFDAIPWLSDAQNKFVEYQTLKVKIFINPNPELGSFSTLQSVLNQINQNCEILLNPIDIPLLNANELNKLIKTKNTVVFPSFKEKNGHPVKMNAEFWLSLLQINVSDENARLDFQIKKLNPAKISIIEVNDKDILKNLNTRAAWVSFLNEKN